MEYKSPKKKKMRDFYAQWLRKNFDDFKKLILCTKSVIYLTQFLTLREVNRLKQVDKYFYQLITSHRIGQESVFFSVGIVKLYRPENLEIDSIKKEFVKLINIHRCSMRKGLIWGEVPKFEYTCYETESILLGKRVVFLIDELDCSHVKPCKVVKYSKRYDFNIFFIGERNSIPRTRIMKERISFAWIANEIDFRTLIHSCDPKSLLFEAVNVHEFLKYPIDHVLSLFIKDYRKFKFHPIVKSVRKVKYGYDCEMTDFINLMVRLNWYHLPTDMKFKLMENFFLYISSSKQGLKKRQKKLFRIQDKKLSFNQNGDGDIEACFFLVKGDQRECMKIVCVIPSSLQMFSNVLKKQTIKRIDYDESCNIM